MADIIQLLQQFGESAQFHGASSEQLGSVLAEAGVSTELRAAVLLNDADKLAELLGTAKRVVCGLFTPDAPDRDGDGEQPDNAPPPPAPEKVRLAA